MSTTPVYVLEAIAESCQEMTRLRSLSNEDLCREYLKLNSDQDDELHVNEMISRLWPEWAEAEL